MKKLTTVYYRVKVMSFPMLILFLLFTVGNVASIQMHAQEGVAPTIIPDGGFAVDGNLLARTPVTGPFTADNGDFLPNDNAPGTGGYVFTADGVPVDTSIAFHIIDGYNSGEAEIFTQGSKFNDDPNTWVWRDGKAPGKDDINHVLFFFSADSLGNIWFVGSGDRLKTKGNTYLDFELLQNPLYQNSDFTFTSMGPHGGRTVGDLAITVIYTIGGSYPQVEMYQWVDTGQGNYGYEEVTPPAGTVYLAMNADSAVSVPYGAFGSYTYQKSAFTEVAVNINEAVPGNYSCLDIKTVIAKTKASHSFNAALKDFISPVQVDISSAPTVSVNDAEVCEGDTAELTATVTSGTGPFTYNWSTGDTTQTIHVAPDTTTQYWVVVSGANGCPSDTAYGTVTVWALPVVTVNSPTICLGDTAVLTATVSSGTGPFTYNWSTGDTSQNIHVAPDTTTQYWVVVTGANGCSSDTAFGTVTVLPPPDCFITGADTICPLATEQYMGPDSMDMYQWTVYGPATIVGDSSLQMVDVMGTGFCDTTFILELYVVDTNGCASSCSMTVVLSDTMPPVIENVPDTLFLSCISEVPDTADYFNVYDDCDPYPEITLSDSTANDTVCINQATIFRTITATDTCGNYTMASHIISIFDSIPPVLYGVPADTGVCCADSIPPPANVYAIDNCDDTVNVVLTEIVSDSTGPSYFTLTRIWTAWDTCTNMVSDSMVIEVNDTLYPAGGGMTGIYSEEDIILYFKVSPNPVINEAKIEFSLSQDADVSLELINFTGVKQSTIYDGRINEGDHVSMVLKPEGSMPAGMYLLVLKTPYGLKSKRILFNK